ncbi:MAG TPA: hypothetical protein VJ553_00045 [Candidatus Paceibacterota bacterium]|nr:hypothetical protein [Candidatus Paceibacterota bacterium]
MVPKTRRTVLGIIAVLLIGGFGFWWYSGFSLEFMKFFAAEERVVPIGSRSPSPDQTPPTVEGMVQCSPAIQTVAVGQGAQITATGGTAGAYKWFAPGGVLSAPNQIGSNPPEAKIVTYDIPGTKKVTVESPRAGTGASGTDEGLIDSVVCTVIVN